MSEYKDMFNPDFQKYGFSEFDFNTPAANTQEPETPDAVQDEDSTAVSRLKTLFQKHKQ